MNRAFFCNFLVVVLTGVLSGCGGDVVDSSVGDGSWMRYEGPSGATSFSSLDQINRSNVHQLEVAWMYESPDVPRINPIVADTFMYVVGEDNAVVALHAGTGRELWSFPTAGFRARAVSYWQSDDRSDRRVFFQEGSRYLVGLDAKTGELLEDFGTGGRVDLRYGLGPDPELVMRATGPAPGVVFEDLIIYGSSPGEGYNVAPGHIRAFNVRTGSQEWIFNTLPQPGEFGYDTWPEGRSDNDNFDPNTARGGANAWGGLSVDRERGIAYVPLGSANYDFYGVDRPGKNLFANSLVALDARTGERIWHFQTVHHDLWDYDLAASPVLLTVEHEGEPVDVVAQALKQGFVFVFNRETGEPLWPIEERSVPPSKMPGEQAWPTQPFPTKPEPFLPITFDLDKDANPYLKDAERDSILQVVGNMDYEGLYTPPSTHPTLQIPGNSGGSNWGSTAADPGTGTFFVLARNRPMVMELKEITGTQLGTGGSPIDRGLVLYQENCSLCHGADLGGQPPAGIPSLHDVTHRLSESEFSDVLSSPRGTMPSFGHLGEGELQALRSYLATPDLALSSGTSDDTSTDGPVRYQSGWDHIVDSDGLPLAKPPWVRLTAYDLNEGTMKWQVPVGDEPALADRGITGTGVSIVSGGPAVTAGGLIFQAAARQLIAYDVEDGSVLWTGDLPASGEGIPAVYEVGGRQYVVVSVPGGDDDSGTPAYVAFALPSN
ncbi:MAG: PQQ-binding-like beta-propeller repeat protein [Rhodothermales bacterium]